MKKKMKTAQIIMRPFLNFKVRQNHQTEFLNCNDALAAVNEIRLKKGLSEKRPDHFFENDHTEYLEALCKYLNVINKNTPDFRVLTPDDLKYVKKGRNGGTWLHPFYFAKFARWLSPEFEAMVDIWISDNVLMLRDNGGDLFKKTNAVLNMVFQIGDNYWEYSKVAKFVSHKVFGTEKNEAWNLATQEELHEREVLLQRIRNAAEFGNFKDINELLDKI